MTIRVILAFSNRIFSESVKRILENEHDLIVAAILDPGAEYTIEQVERHASQVVLTDIISLYNCFPDLERTDRKVHFVLLDTNCGKETLVSTILKKKINGVLLSDSDQDLLKKCVRSVAKGEVWLDKQTFKSILYGINAIDNNRDGALTPREKEIVELIGKGFRNKEIAHKLSISEPTVKTHLNRIFKKLNLKARSELISYSIKTSDNNNSHSIKITH